MKNKEKYAKEIACSGDCIAVEISTGRPVLCNSIWCANCLFSKGCISYTKDECIKKWAESEYIEKQVIVISKRDRAFLEYIKEEFKYISRDDGNEQLFACSEKPQKGLSINEWLDMKSDAIGLYGFNLDLPMVKWSDSEPWLIEDLKKLEVVDSYE